MDSWADVSCGDADYAPLCATAVFYSHVREQPPRHRHPLAVAVGAERQQTPENWRPCPAVLPTTPGEGVRNAVRHTQPFYALVMLQRVRTVRDR